MNEKTKKYKSEIKKLMIANRHKGNGYQYTVPSPNTYPYQWLWDSCFHGIILSYFDIKSAKAELKTLTLRQFDNGMIPHMVYWQLAPLSVFPRISWGRRGTSTITQPPMLAYASMQIYEKDKDIKFLKSMYKPMKHFYEYFFKERNPGNENIIGIINPDESGEDNSPRFDAALKLNANHSLDSNFAKRMALIEQNKVCKFKTKCMDDFCWVRDVSFNSILVKNLNVMSDIAKILDNKNDAIHFSKLASDVSIALRRNLLDKEGIINSTNGIKKAKIKTLTWAIFMPLFAEILTPNEAKRLVERHLNNKSEFYTEYSVPTVAINQASFDPKGFWRGPVWVGTNWFIYHGLKNYGFNKDAKRVLNSTLRLVNKSGYREYYNPQTGEGYGAQEFTWGGLILDMN